MEILMLQIIFAIYLTAILLIIGIFRWKSIYAKILPDRFFRAHIRLNSGRARHYLEFEDGSANFSPKDLKGKTFNKTKGYPEDVTTYYWVENRADAIDFDNIGKGKTAEEWDNDLAIEQMDFWKDNSLNLDRILSLICIGICGITLIISIISMTKSSEAASVSKQILSLLMPK